MLWRHSAISLLSQRMIDAGNAVYPSTDPVFS
jgi:hypothetical protein